jgi:hypothetical protein
MMAVSDDPLIEEMVYTSIHRLVYQQNYAIREVALFIIWYICEAIPPNLVSEKLLPSALLLATDPVPNVRILTVKVLRKLQPLVGEGQRQAEIKRRIARFAEDADLDVQQEAMAERTVIDYYPRNA